MRMRLLPLALMVATSAGAQAPAPAGAAQQTPASSELSRPAAVEGDGYLYVSGQGPRRKDGSTPTGFAQQARQCLENVRGVVETFGLKMDHVVYVQVYLEDVSQYGELNKVFAEYFPKDAPARGVLGVARVPESPLQITAVAVRDLTGKLAVNLPNGKVEKAFSLGMLTHDRLFVSTMPGSDPATGKVPDDPAAQVDFALDRMKDVVEAAGLKLSHMVFVNPYLTRDIPPRIMNEHYARRFEFGNTPGRATIQVSSLPEGVHIAYTGVAVRDLSKRRSIRPKNMAPSPTASPCVFAGDTLYCSAKSGFIPGPNSGVYAATTTHQARQTMRNQLDNLEEAEMKFDQVVYTTVYLDDLADLPAWERVYEKYFKGRLPAQTSLQQIQPTERKANEEEQYPDLEQMSLIAVRKQ